MQKPEVARQLLPASAYISDAWYAREQQELFSRSWVWVGMVEDFAAVGDYVAVQIGPYPIFVIRDEHGELHSFHNICRHRGMQPLEGSGNAAKGIRCPYHYWTYDLNGCLLGMPRREELFQGLDSTTRSLLPASIGILDHMVFVNPQAEPDECFDKWLDRTPEFLWSHQLSTLAEARSARYELGCNWKVFTENAIDAYHLAYLHAATLGGPDPLDMDWISAGRQWIFLGQGTDTAQRTESDIPLIPEFDGTKPGPLVWWFFPNCGVLATSVFWSVFSVVPQGPERCYVDVRSWISAEARAQAAYYKLFPGTGDNYADNRNITLRDLKGHPLDSGDFMIEDMWVCERLQQAMHSPVYQVDRLAHNAESSITFFQQNLLDFVPLRN